MDIPFLSTNWLASHAHSIQILVCGSAFVEKTKVELALGHI